MHMMMVLAGRELIQVFMPHVFCPLNQALIVEELEHAKHRTAVNAFCANM